MMNWVKILLVFLVSLALMSQAADVSNTDSAKPGKEVGLQGTEKKLDERIARLNERLKSYTKLFKMKLLVQPHKTFLMKGKANGDVCDTNRSQMADDNDCLKLQVVDFVGSEHGQSPLKLGSKSKYVSVFYEGGAKEKDPELEKPGKIKKIISNIVVNDFEHQDIKLSEVSDNAPAEEKGNVDNKNIFVFYQHDGYPRPSTEQNPAEKGIGKYSLDSVENTEANPSRNEFKKEYYLKHLDQYDRLFSTIFDANEEVGNKRYRESNEVLKNSLKY